MGRPEDTCQMFALFHVRANGHSPKESHTAPVMLGDKEVSEALAGLDIMPVYDEDGGTIVNYRRVLAQVRCGEVNGGIDDGLGTSGRM